MAAIVLTQGHFKNTAAQLVLSFIVIKVDLVEWVLFEDFQFFYFWFACHLIKFVVANYWIRQFTVAFWSLPLFVWLGFLVTAFGVFDLLRVVLV